MKKNFVTDRIEKRIHFPAFSIPKEGTPRINCLTHLLAFVLLLTFTQACGKVKVYAGSSSASSCPGFPIEGFGKDTVGGCGGTVYTVTNLNDSGPGSLRDFVDRSGPRIIKFAVAGTIQLQSRLSISAPFITIDGSSAPAGGIALKGEGISTNTHDVIIRYIRVRPGPGDNPDAIQITGSNGQIPYNVVIDHVSASWAPDGSIDITNRAYNITVQWSILSENIGPGHMLLSYEATKVTLHHNLFALGGRNPDITGGEIDLVNNVIYDWDGCCTNYVVPARSPALVNYVKNYWKPGLDSVDPTRYGQIYLRGNIPTKPVPYASQSKVYVQGNIGPSRPNNNLPETDIVEQDNGGLAIAGSRFNYPPVTTTSALTAYNDVLAKAGATLPCRDAVDKRIVSAAANGTGRALPTDGNPSLVGGWPDLTKPCAAPSVNTRLPSLHIAPAAADASSQTGLSWGASEDVPVPSDYDGDGRKDIAVWRPSEGNWYLHPTSPTPPWSQPWGALDDKPVPGDYDGDGKTDLAVWRPSTGTWYILHSLDNTPLIQTLGDASVSLVPGDYDGDGKTDLAIFTPWSGTWSIRPSGGGDPLDTLWGQEGDIPVPADYDGDKTTDLAVWRPSEGNWYLQLSSGGLEVLKWGEAGDRPVPGDYDGDGITDLAIFKASSGEWEIQPSQGGALLRKQLGQADDVPVPEDYDGDGKTDVAVWRASEGKWYIPD